MAVSLPPNLAARLQQYGLVAAAAFSLPPALYSYFTSSSADSSANITTALPLIVLASAMLLLVDPFVDQKLASQNFSKYLHITVGWTCTSAAAWFVGLVAFGLRFSWTDLFLLGLGRWVIGSILPPSYMSHADALAKFKENEDAGGGGGGKKLRRSPLERAEAFSRQLKAVVKSILANDESRRIYYFLCLNFAYMGVQMM